MQALDEQPSTQLAQAELRAALTAVLRAGQLLLEAGADTQRVEETMQRVGTVTALVRLRGYFAPR